MRGMVNLPLMSTEAFLFLLHVSENRILFKNLFDSRRRRATYDFTVAFRSVYLQVCIHFSWKPQAAKPRESYIAWDSCRAAPLFLSANISRLTLVLKTT